MAGEQDKDTDNIHEALEDPGKAARRSFPRSLPVIIILGVLIAAALLLTTLPGEEESPGVVLDSSEAISIAEATLPPQAQEFSPQALEDLRSAPLDSLEINPEPLLLEPLPEENPEVADDDFVAPDVPAEETLAPPEAPFSVGEALARYLLAVRNELNSEYVANCIRHRNRNGAGAGCPENPALTADNNQEEIALVDDLFAIITRQDEYRRISSRLELENETLAAILDDPDNPAALQASTKLALNNSYLSYLSGNPSPAVTAFNTMNDFVNDYNRTIKVGPVQFRCQGGPCVYEYNGPGAE